MGRVGPGARPKRFAMAPSSKGGRSTRWSGCACPGRNPVVVTAGFHGDEKAGPRTILDHTPEIVAYAAERGVGPDLVPVA